MLTLTVSTIGMIWTRSLQVIPHMHEHWQQPGLDVHSFTNYSLAALRLDDFFPQEVDFSELIAQRPGAGGLEGSTKSSDDRSTQNLSETKSTRNVESDGEDADLSDGQRVERRYKFLCRFGLACVYLLIRELFLL